LSIAETRLGFRIRSLKLSQYFLVQLNPAGRILSTFELCSRAQRIGRFRLRFDRRRRIEIVGRHDVQCTLQVPARVGGRWALRDDKDWEAEIAVTQEFQRIGGTITIKGRTQPLLGAYVNGAIVGFTFVDKDGAIRSMRGQVDGDRIAGQLRFVGNITLLTGRKL